MRERSSVNEAEVKYFCELAPHWWDERGPLALLYQINPVRLKYLYHQVIRHCNISSTTSQPFLGLKVLDVGCGGGLVCEPLCRLGAEVVGVDSSIHIPLSGQRTYLTSLLVKELP